MSSTNSRIYHSSSLQATIQGHPEMPRLRYQTFERKGFLLPAGGTCSNKEFESTLKVESCLGRLTELNSCKHKCQGRLYENSRTT